MSIPVGVFNKFNLEELQTLAFDVGVEYTLNDDEDILRTKIMSVTVEGE